MPLSRAPCSISVDEDLEDDGPQLHSPSTHCSVAPLFQRGPGACPPQGHPLPADPADAARRPPGGHLEAAGLRGLHPPPGAWSGGARDPSTASALASWAIPPPPPTLGPESPAGQAGSVPTFPQAGTGGARGGGKRDVHCGRSIRMPRNLSLCKAPSSPVKAGWGPA